MLLAVAVACRSDRLPQHDDSARTVPASASAAASARPQANASLDSAELRPGLGLPHPGSWAPTSTYEGDRFTIAYPGSATLKRREAPGGGKPELTVSELPECKWPCYVTVSLWRDSAGTGLSGLLRERMTGDTSGGNADAADYVPTLVDSLPLGGAPAAHLELHCGDCTSHGIYSAYGGWIAAVEYTMDDRDGYNPALLARLEAVARSFRWRRQ